MHAPEDSLFNTILIICLVLGCIIAFFIFSMIRQHRKNIEMYKSKLSAEINTLEKERARIAADLHDDMGPMLSAIKLKMSSLDVKAEDEVTLKDAEHYIDDVIKKMRTISNDLLPATLLRKGLVYATEEFIQILSLKDKMKIFFTHGEIPPLYAELCINLYRMIQEIIHNALKHSGAGSMKIDLRTEGDKLLLVSTDDGKGFDTQKAQRDKTGLGLRNLWSRTELLHGDLFVESVPGKGVTYSIELPIQKK